MCRLFKVVAVSALPDDAPQGLDELLQFFTTAAQAKTSQATTAEQRVSIARITCRNKHGE